MTITAKNSAQWSRLDVDADKPAFITPAALLQVCDVGGQRAQISLVNDLPEPVDDLAGENRFALLYFVRERNGSYEQWPLRRFQVLQLIRRLSSICAAEDAAFDRGDEAPF